LLWLLATLGVLAHPGGLDANGGHTDRATGIYHYHRGTNTLSGNTTNPSPVDVETNRIEMESTATEWQTMPVKNGPAPALSKLPWWLFLVVLGSIYLVWEVAYRLYQKRKGNR